MCRNFVFVSSADFSLLVPPHLPYCIALVLSPDAMPEALGIVTRRRKTKAAKKENLRGKFTKKTLLYAVQKAFFSAVIFVFVFFLHPHDNVLSKQDIPPITAVSR